MNAFTLWTRGALDAIEIAVTSNGRHYGVAYLGEVWFRFCGPMIYCHLPSGADACARMERRGS